MKKGKILVFFGIILTIATVLIVIWQLRPARKRPNVVLIVVDALRADHLPFYGYKRTDTPFLSSLAKRAILFEHAWAPSSWTTPSVASIFTSLYPFQHGVVSNLIAFKKSAAPETQLTAVLIPDSALTMAEIFRNAGYKTFGVSMNINVTAERKFDKGFDRFAYKDGGKDADFANRQLREWKSEIQAAKSSFIYIHYMDCHIPYRRMNPWYVPGTDNISNHIAAYDSEISYLDRRIQEISKFFDWEHDTLIIFTSDHGEEFKEHGELGHGKALFRESIEVPLFFILPEKVVPRRVEANVTTLDILPTLRNYLGLEKDNKNAGVSLLPNWESPKESAADRYIFSHLTVKREKNTGRKKIFVSRAVIFQNWHSIISVFPHEKQLFNWWLDPLEKNDCLESEPDLGKLLFFKFFEFEKNCMKLPLRPEDESVINLDDRQIRELETLGYIQ